MRYTRVVTVANRSGLSWADTLLRSKKLAREETNTTVEGGEIEVSGTRVDPQTRNFHLLFAYSMI